MAEKLGRRTFLEAAGLTVAMETSARGEANATGAGAAAWSAPGELRSDIAALVDKTPFVDTHEHLWEESVRIRSKTEKTDLPAPDFGMLLSHYMDSDLQVAGMELNDYKKLRAWELSPGEKWQLVAPYYARCRHTGYAQCVRETVRALYGEEDLREDNCETISEKLAGQIKPGFYRHILCDAANIRYCHVNALETLGSASKEENLVFRNTAQPELLAQDIATPGIASGVSMGVLERIAGGPVHTLDAAHALIDRCFRLYGPRAIAVKDQCAYGRSLSFDNVPDEVAAPIFARFAADAKSVTDTERKALQDNLFRYCIWKAEEHGLPVKLHTGYYAGHDGMPLERVRRNASDLCSLARDFPKTKFVLMHIGYPYQDEMIAMGKHYRNVYIDMCWAWIINPSASVRFLKEFLMAAPGCKVFTFGGDFMPVELVVGHARMARKGLSQALAELVEEHWITESDVPRLAADLMHGNCDAVFDHERTLRNWNTSQ